MVGLKYRGVSGHRKNQALLSFTLIQQRATMQIGQRQGAGSEAQLNAPWKLQMESSQSQVVSVKQCTPWCWLTGETNCCCKSIKEGKKGYHMVLTAVSLSRWNASKTVTTTLHYFDKFCDSRWELFYLGLGLFLLFFNRLMCYPHPETVTLGI